MDTKLIPLDFERVFNDIFTSNMSNEEREAALRSLYGL